MTPIVHGASSLAVEHSLVPIRNVFDGELGGKYNVIPHVDVAVERVKRVRAAVL